MDVIIFITMTEVGLLLTEFYFVLRCEVHARFRQRGINIIIMKV